MLDATVRRSLAAPLDRAAAALHRAGLGPNSVTFAAFMCGLLAIAFTGLSFYLAALVFLFLFRAFDLIDGALARRTRITPLGGFLDLSLGYLIWGGVAFAFVLSRQQNGLAGTFLILALMADAVTCIAARLFSVLPEKGGPIPRSLIISGQTESFIVFAVMMLVPWSFGFLPYLYGVLCFITAGARIASATAVLEPPANS
jgi:phosphatidylglycerophosphate synthase